MSIDLEKFRAALEADLADPNGYWNTLIKKDEAARARFPKVEAYIEKHGMPAVMDRLVREHGEEWEQKCWDRGCETYPNQKFNLLWKYITESYEPVHNDRIPQDFLSASYFVKGYWFTIYCGQGCFYRVYDHDINTILQI